MYHIRPHLRLHLFHYFKNKELDELYFSVGIRSFAESMILIFVPIYLLTLGHAFTDIIIFFAIFYTAINIFYPLATYVNSILGLKKSMFIGIVFLIIYNIVLDQIAAGVPYQYAAIIWSVSISFYYTAFHIDFAKVSDKRKEGKEFSRIKILMILSAAFGPLIGSILITEMSYTFLFMFVSMLLLISAFPLFLTKDIKIKKPNLKFSRIIRADTKRRAIGTQGLGMIDFTSAFLWPLFIFLILGEVLQLGLIITGTSIILIIFLFYIGRLSDRHEKRTLRIGIGVHSVSWLTRLFFLTPIGLFVNNFYAALSYSFIEVPYHKIIYENAKKAKNIANYFIFREINLWIGRITILIIAYLVADIRVLFIVGFFASFLFTAMLKDTKKHRKVKRRKRRK